MIGRILTSTNVDEIEKMWCASNSSFSDSDQEEEIDNEEEAEESMEDAPEEEGDYEEAVDIEESEEEEESVVDEDEACDEVPDGPINEDYDFFHYNGDADQSDENKEEGEGHVSASEFLSDSGTSSNPANRTRIAMVKGNIKETEKNMMTSAPRSARKHSGPYGNK